MKTEQRLEGCGHMPRMPGAPEAGWGRRDPPLEPPEGARPGRHLGFGLVVSRMRETQCPRF